MLLLDKTNIGASTPAICTPEALLSAVHEHFWNDAIALRWIPQQNSQRIFSPSLFVEQPRATVWNLPHNCLNDLRVSHELTMYTFTFASSVVNWSLSCSNLACSFLHCS